MNSKENHPGTSSGTHIVRLPNVLVKTGMSRSWIYDRIKKRNFPAPIQLGQKAVGWIASEVDDWVANRVSASRKVEGSLQ